jgi:hypothetical protein
MNRTQQAIEAMEGCAKIYGVCFEISYKRRNKGYVSMYSDKWKVKVFTEIFYDEDFTKAIGKAVEFVVKTFAPHLLNDGQGDNRSVATTA